MKTALLLASGVLAASCGAQTSQEAAGAGDLIDCALNGAPQFERVCMVERRQGERGTELIVRAPDGAFRRLLVARDGRGVVAADGAVEAVVTIVAQGMIEVALAEDRYRLPATIQAAPQTDQ